MLAEPLIYDLRSALKALSDKPNELLVTEQLVNADTELAGVYRKIGAGCPVAPPTKVGPAMLFNNVEGFPDFRVLTGLMASRQRTATLLNSTQEQLPFSLLEAYRNPISPVPFEGNTPPCQEVVHTKDIDLFKMLPSPKNTVDDAGPYLNMGLIRAQDPDTGDADVTIHRLCIQDKDLLSVYFVPGRHIDQFRIKAEESNQPLPVSINLGLDPACYVTACFEPPSTPLGFDELSIAGGLRKKGIELAPCLTVDAKAIAHAEIVIEGIILPNERIREDVNTNTGFAMPEFPGYLGPAQQALPVIKVTAVTYRKKPIMQTIIGPGEEHTNLAGIPTEASILHLVENAMPNRLKNVYCHSAGGGKYLAIMQFIKHSEQDEGRHRQAALTAFAAFSELKHIILVDEDVDIYDSNDVLWAMTTRYQGDIDTVFIPGVRCHPLDPTQSPEYHPLIQAFSTSCKAIYDCTVPFKQKERFKRAQFVDVDIAPFIANRVPYNDVS